MKKIIPFLTLIIGFVGCFVLCKFVILSNSDMCITKNVDSKEEKKLISYRFYGDSDEEALKVWEDNNLSSYFYLNDDLKNEYDYTDFRYLLSSIDCKLSDADSIVVYRVLYDIAQKDNKLIMIPFEEYDYCFPGSSDCLAVSIDYANEVMKRFNISPSELEKYFDKEQIYDGKYLWQGEGSTGIDYMEVIGSKVYFDSDNLKYVENVLFYTVSENAENYNLDFVDVEYTFKEKDGYYYIDSVSQIKG